MQGGTSRNGRSCTLAVSGLYSISWNSSFSNTTAPSVVATLRPTSNRLSSVIDTWPCRMSCSMFFTPLARLSPCVAMAFCCASALKARKLLGAEAASHCSTAKRTRLRVLASPSAASAMDIMVRAFSRYTAAVKAAMGFLPQASPLKRRSASCGLSCRVWFQSSEASRT